jgi:hypothetical protein
MTGAGGRQAVRLVYFLTFFAVLLMPQAVFAQLLPRSCEADYYTSMTARSDLAIAREMEAAQRIIRKPDSTLEYTCFSVSVLDHLATANMWSDTQDANSMDVTLNRLILTPMNRYLDQNFWHIYLGGVFGGVPITGGFCNAMDQVWFAAKCQDFNFDFLRFNQMPTNDPRLLPRPCTTSASARQGYMDAMIAAAYPAPGALGGMDILDTFQQEMSVCATPPVPTGIWIRLSGGGTVEDAVCIAPGCFNNGGACVPN